MKSVKRTCSTSPRAPSGVLAVLTVHYDCHSVKIETELVICSIACHSLHEKWLCIFMFTKPASVESPSSSAVPLFPISPLLLLLFFVFPDSSVLSTLSLGQIRLSCIPDIPAAYVRNSIWLLWARSLLHSFFSIALFLTHRLSLYSSTSGLPWLRLHCQVWPSPPPSLYFWLHHPRKGGRQNWGFCRRPWYRLIYR